MPLGQRRTSQPGPLGPGEKRTILKPGWRLMKVEVNGPVTDLETGQVLEEESAHWDDDPGGFIEDYNFLYWVFADGYKANNDPQFRLQPTSWQWVHYGVAEYPVEAALLDAALTRIMNATLSIVQDRAARRHVDPELVALEDMEQDYRPIAKEIGKNPDDVLKWIRKKKEVFK